MTWLRAVALCLAWFLYFRSPIDLIPDRIGLPGFVDDLILLAAAAWWLRQRLRAPGRPGSGREGAESGGAAGEWNPYAVLDVPAGASREEITRAYHAQMKRYHPDRVADLGAELQTVAHRKTLEIQRAYEDLKSR